MIDDFIMTAVATAIARNMEDKPVAEGVPF